MRPSLDTLARNWSTPTAHDGHRPGPDLHSTQAGNLRRDAANWPTPRVVDAEQRGTWPTPTSGDAKESGAAGYSTDSGRHSGTTLTDAAVRRWPTPTTFDAEHATPHSEHNESLSSASGKWPTPISSDTNGSREEDGRRSTGLNTKAENWATPAARDWKSDDPTQSPDHSPPLGRQVLKGTGAECRKRLNPLFVEWLMGLPFGWTGFEPLGTVSARLKLRSPSGSSQESS